MCAFSNLSFTLKSLKVILLALSLLLSPVPIVDAVLNKAPPLHLPTSNMKLNLCAVGNTGTSPGVVSTGSSSSSSASGSSYFFGSSYDTTPQQQNLPQNINNNMPHMVYNLDSHTSSTPGLAILFLDGSDEFSRRQYKAFAHLAQHYAGMINFVGIESYSLQNGSTGGVPGAVPMEGGVVGMSGAVQQDQKIMSAWEVCEATHQPRNSPAQFTLDRHDFFRDQYAYEFFGVSPNEIVLYHAGQRFRYLPKLQADLTRPISHGWVRTGLDELRGAIEAVSTVNSYNSYGGGYGKNNGYGSTSVASAAQSQGVNANGNQQGNTNAAALSSADALYLSNEYDRFPGFTIPNEGEVGRIMQASGQARCEEHCREIGCTSFIIYGQHHCSFYAGEPWAIRHLRERYSDAQLYIRRPLHDVNATSKLLSGFLLASLVILTASGCFVVCNKTGVRKSVTDIESMGNFGMSNMNGMSMGGSTNNAINMPSNMSMSDFTDRMSNITDHFPDSITNASQLVQEKVLQQIGINNNSMNQNNINNLNSNSGNLINCSSGNSPAKSPLNGGVMSPTNDHTICHSGHNSGSEMNELGEKLVIDGAEEPAE